MYTQSMIDSVNRLEETRSKRMKQKLSLLTSEEKYNLLNKFHPDYKKGTLRELKIGPNKGERVINEIANLFEAYSQIDPINFDISEIDHDIDVLIIGGGGAGLRAAIEARRYGVDVTLVEKMEPGRVSNSAFAGGGFRSFKSPGLKAFHTFNDHFKRTIEIGDYLPNQRLAEIFTLEAYPRIVEMEEFGVDLSLPSAPHRGGRG